VRIELTIGVLQFSIWRFRMFQRVRPCSIEMAMDENLVEKWNAVKHGGTSANVVEQVYPRGVSRRFSTHRAPLKHAHKIWAQIGTDCRRLARVGSPV
jgi:hypothetical protein